MISVHPKAIGKYANSTTNNIKPSTNFSDGFFLFLYYDRSKGKRLFHRQSLWMLYIRKEKATMAGGLPAMGGFSFHDYILKGEYPNGMD